LYIDFSNIKQSLIEKSDVIIHFCRCFKYRNTFLG